MIKEIFKGRELTSFSKTSTFAIDTRYYYYEITNSLAKDLIFTKVLIPDSGNLETGEIHYIYNREYFEFKDSSSILDVMNITHELELKRIIRDIKLTKLGI